jgi:hypothetical protein
VFVLFQLPFPILYQKVILNHSSHFNEDRSKWEDSPQHHDAKWLHKPLLLRDWLGHCVDPAGVVGLARDVASQNSAHQIEWQDDKQADAYNRELHDKVKIINGRSTNIGTENVVYNCDTLYQKRKIGSLVPQSHDSSPW